MSTVAIVLIAVGVLALLAIAYLAVLSPKRRAERRLAAERSEAADHHRSRASEQHTRASVADQKAEEARLHAQRAEQEAELARQEASAHEGRADLHDQGLADDELQTAGPDEPTTQLDRPDRLSDRRGEAIEPDANGRYQSTGSVRRSTRF